MALNIQKYLIDDWKKCWKFLEVQISVVIAGLAILPAYIPSLQQYGIDPRLIGILAIVGILARVTRVAERHGDVVGTLTANIAEQQALLAPTAVTVVNQSVEQSAQAVHSILQDIQARDVKK